MKRGLPFGRGARRSARFAFAVLALSLAASGLGSAHPSSVGYADSFDTLGPLPAGPTDNWQVTAGAWTVVDRPRVDGIPQLGIERVLQQSSRATTPNEPIAFVRGRSFRALAVQVTAAILDDVVNASIGIVFRAPVQEDGTADKDNLYLFTATNTGIVGPFSTGKAFVLFKRVGRGYFLHTAKIVNTWMDLTKPHDYKVVMSGGRIQAFVDGRLVIEHADIASGDTPTTADPFPGLPFDSGAVGVRTSGTRAFFDNFVVIGAPDGAEARAAATDGYLTYGQDGQVRKGVAVQLSSQAEVADTGFVYHDHDFDDAVVRPADPNSNGQPSAGAALRAVGANGVVTSTAEVFGLNASVTDPTQRVTVTISADAIRGRAQASCSGADSSVNVANGSIYVRVANTAPVPGPPTVLGPFPFDSSYPPNTLVAEYPGLFKIVAHERVVTTNPRRVEVAMLKVIFPESPVQAGGIPISLPPPLPSGGVPTVSAGRSPVVEAAVGLLVAGRYC